MPSFIDKLPPISGGSALNRKLISKIVRVSDQGRVTALLVKFKYSRGTGPRTA